jgi:adenosylcobinamide-GDP ribazoletransferase
MVGALLGAMGAGLFLLLEPYMAAELRALIVLVFWVAITGALHEDGLADVADAFRAGRSRETIIEILKDPHVGAYGVVAVVLSLLIRWQALAAITADPLRALAAAMAVSRASMVVLARISRPATNSMGGEFVRQVTVPAVLLASAQAVAAAAWCGPRIGVALIVGTMAIVALAWLWFHRRLNGINGDCLGATCQVAEAFALVLMASPIEWE